MTTYRESGVDIKIGDEASHIAFSLAKSTFGGRKGLIGEPFSDDGGFAGLLDFKDFYITQCCDTVGTKIDLAEQIGDFSTLGSDLLAMVADDAVCLGAEVVSITNTFETKKVNPQEIEAMMKSLAKACLGQKIVIAGGEIAEVGQKIAGTSWGADAIGIVAKNRVIKNDQIKSGDSIIALAERGFRCNGLSLVRKILKDNFFHDQSLYAQKAKEALIPSIVYHNAILALHGRFNEKPELDLKGVAHITGGGIPGNLNRILKKNNLGANLSKIKHPPLIMEEIINIGQVEISEAFKALNMGVGMLLVVDPSDKQKALKILADNNIAAYEIGEIMPNPQILIKNPLADNVLAFDLNAFFMGIF